jgi:hypothetical protein
MKPQFSHDCPQCKFLGISSDGKDLYFCPKGLTTLIARYGDGGPRYVSGIAFADTVPALGEAKKLAIDAGLTIDKAKMPDGDLIYVLYECKFADDTQDFDRTTIAVSPSLSKIQQWVAVNKPEYTLDPAEPGDDELIYDNGADYLVCYLNKKIPSL